MKNTWTFLYFEERISLRNNLRFNFLPHPNMETLYFIVLTLAGGVLLLFFAAGWTSYKEKKIPETPILFRWFVAGIIGTGLAAYTWIFGYGGDVGEVVQKLGEVISSDDFLSEPNQEGSDSQSITVGFPRF